MYKRPYVESSVFIAYIKGEIKDGQDCKLIVDAILAFAEDGVFPICTSSLTIAEVFKTKRGIPLSDQENEDLRPYFRESYIRLIEVDRDIAERANELCAGCMAGERALRPNDAIHLASAERAGCEVLLSYDADLLHQAHPAISIEIPQIQVVLKPGPIEFSLQSVLALKASNDHDDKTEDEAADSGKALPAPSPDPTPEPKLELKPESEPEVEAQIVGEVSPEIVTETAIPPSPPLGLGK